nr:hypothetical protein [Sphingomonas sp. dw_22]
MRLGKLVPNGDARQAQECSYSFRPGRAFLAGDANSQPVDFRYGVGPKHVVVDPGKMIWIRTREHVKIPTNMVGFWWQTNSLSRRGLMLVNMSMVEPGYEGDLACLFVNFGNQHIPINGDTNIAKMVFVDIRGDVENPFQGQTPRTQYDASLHDLAVNQPSSFLQVGDLATSLDKQKTEAIGEIQTARQKAVADAVAEFKQDAPKKIWGTYAWAALALLLLTAITSGANWARDNLFPDSKKIARAEAEATLRERVTIPAAADSGETAELTKRIQELNTRIAKLEKKEP